MLQNLKVGIYVETLTLKFWVIPTIIAILFVFLQILFIMLPNEIYESTVTEALFTSYSTDGARMILSTMGTSLMTVIGVITSLTVMLLQQVSNQYSPRVIESFIRSFSTQFMLGAYVGTFICCLILLRQIPPDDGNSEASIPQAAVTFSIFLAMMCTGLLIQYLKNIVHAIKSTNIIVEIREESLRYMSKFSEFIRSHEVAETLEQLGLDYPFKYRINASESGYLQGLNAEKLKNILKDKKATVEISPITGDYLFEDQLLADIKSEMPLDADEEKKLKEVFKIGHDRTHSQDLRFGIRQLVDIALRGLSPGVHDPNTAVESLNSIGVILLKFGKDCHFKEVIKINQIFIKIPKVHFKDLIELAISQILQVASDQPVITHRVKEILNILETEDQYTGGRNFSIRAQEQTLS
jgi:uncharacterized membrane protein